jgi:hypothetical protein
MLLEELKVGLGMGLILEELLVGRLVHGRSLDICENARDPGQSRYSRAEFAKWWWPYRSIIQQRQSRVTTESNCGRICDQSAVDDDDGGVEATTPGGGSHEPLHTRSIVLT